MKQHHAIRPLLLSKRSSPRAYLLLTCLSLVGCSLSPIAKHTAAFSSATSLVTSNSADAYRSAIAIHEQEEAVAAAVNFDEDPGWDLRKLKPLISDEDLNVRIGLLAALKTYAQDLADVASGASSKELDDAASAFGSSLQTLSKSVDGAFNLQASGPAKITDQEKAGASTAIRAIAEYLQSKRAKAGIKKVTGDLDPQIAAICTLLEKDTLILRRQTHDDYEQMIGNEITFLRGPGLKLTPIERRIEIQTLPTMRAKEFAEDGLLTSLEKALSELALTHHALAAAAQGNNPASLSARISALAAAGSELGNYYQAQLTK